MALFDGYTDGIITRSEISYLKNQTAQTLIEIESVGTKGEGFLAQRQKTICFTEKIVKKLRKTEKIANITKISSGVGGIAGAGVAVAGILLAPFSAGLSLGLTVGGVGVTAASGATGVGSQIVKSVIESNALDDIQEAIKMEHRVASAIAQKIARIEEGIKRIQELYDDLIGRAKRIKTEVKVVKPTETTLI